MKGERGLDKIPFRWGGIAHNYDMDNEDWQEGAWSLLKKKPMRCYSCNGVMKNTRGQNGTLHKRNYPYVAVFRILHGKDKGKFAFRALCRGCAYRYGRGVIEMNGKTYIKPGDFNEEKYKKEANDEQA